MNDKEAPTTEMSVNSYGHCTRRSLQAVLFDTLYCYNYGYASRLALSNSHMNIVIVQFYY